jgi:DNA-binding MarR family transcriptional regulator
MASTHRGQGRILSLLKIKPEMSQKELASILDIRPQSLGELLGKLEKAGYITRTPSDADRRVMDIHLTEAGKTATKEPGEGEGPGGMFECLDESERETFAGYLDRITEHLEAQLGNDDHPHGFRRRPDFAEMRDFAGRFGRGGAPGRGGPDFRGGSHGPRRHR